MLNVVLVEPEIPPNTGNIARLCLATGAHLHLIQPLGFSLEDKHLLRAGMDYWPEVSKTIWPSWDAFSDKILKSPSNSVYFLTTKSTRPYTEIQFRPHDYLIFGRETKGLPESLLKQFHDRTITIPMDPRARSLNLATSVGIVLYEAVRQNSGKTR